MGIDKFGRAPSSSSYSLRSQRVGIQTLGFALTKAGDFDIQDKRICNLRKPTESKDATTKSYVDDKIDVVRNEMRQKIFQQGNKLKVLQDHFQEQEKLISDLLKTGVIISTATKENNVLPNENNPAKVPSPVTLPSGSINKSNKKMSIIS